MTVTSLAACGDDEKFKPVGEGGDSAGKVLAAAPAKTRAARTAKQFTSITAGGHKIFHATGFSRLDRDRAHLHITYDTKLGRLEAGSTADAVVDGDDYYLRLESSPDWIRIPSDADDGTFSTGVAESLDYLSAVTGNAKADGEETVRGVPTRVYSATVDLNRVADNLPAGERDAYLKKLEDEDLPRSLPLKVAIDEEGRIVRMDYRATVRGSEVETRFELFDFGSDGDLSVPKRFVEGG